GHVQYLVDAREAHPLAQLPHLDLVHHKAITPLLLPDAGKSAYFPYPLPLDFFAFPGRGTQGKRRTRPTLVQL
ncbi:MAG: hypothetical protein IJQ33_06195, partial [Clostridia bacterium]|nr:hypothetical protein [Clostridia bacterium]